MLFVLRVSCLLLLVLASQTLEASDKKVGEACTFQDKKLYGKIQIVEHFADLKVQAVDSFPDLKVKVVANFPDDCGEWQLVGNFPNLKVQFVDHFPDLKIQFVESFPGRP